MAGGDLRWPDKPVYSGALDQNIVGLINELNRLPGIVTIGSCGGHKEPRPGQRAEGTWIVSFRVDRERTLALAWLVRAMARYGDRVLIDFLPPLVDEHWYCALAGWDINPSTVEERVRNLAGRLAPGAQG